MEKKSAESVRLSGTEKEIVRVLKERMKVHLEDFNCDVNQSQGVHGGWISKGEVATALQSLRRKGVVRATRDEPYRYWNWSLVVPNQV